MSIPSTDEKGAVDVTGADADPPEYTFPESPAQMVVQRPVYTETEFSSQWTISTPVRPTVSERASSWCRANCTCSGKCVKDLLFQYLPFLRIMSRYKWRTDLIGDLVAGITVGIVQIPQGMAYGLLAAVEPVFGLYSSFFPVLIYFFFGTSNHISMGTFAITSLMVGSVVERFDCSGGGDSSGGGGGLDNVTSLPDLTTAAVTGGSSDFTEEQLCKIGIAATVTFLGGVLELGLGLLRLGWLTIYLSEPLTRGYTTASAIYVMTSQLKYLFGLSLTRYSGPLNMFYTYIELFPKLPDSNVSAIVISVICILILAVFKEHVQPRFKKKFKVPFPIELVVVIGATLASYYGMFADKYTTDVVGSIPTGIPAPKVPSFNNVGELLPSAISIAIVGYANSMSLAKLFAKKHGYKVDATQELLAHGISNTASSFFSCIFGAPSMSRTLVYEGAGAVTQLAGVVSCVLILLVLLFIGPLFSELPKAVLGCVIVVALKGMFLQFHDVRNLWKVDKVDLSIWLVTFVATIFLDVDLGLGVGVLYTLLTVVYRTQRAHSALLGQIPNTDIYRNIKKFDDVEEIPGIKLFRFEAALHYANRERFQEELVRRTGLDASMIKILQRKQRKAGSKQSTYPSDSTTPTSVRKFAAPADPKEVALALSEEIHALIVDCSVMSYIDSMGASCLVEVVREYKDIGIHVYFARLRAPARKTLRKAGFYDKVADDAIYVSVHDAVLAALHKQGKGSQALFGSTNTVQTVTSYM